jgi:hypothetical protein
MVVYVPSPLLSRMTEELAVRGATQIGRLKLNHRVSAKPGEQQPLCQRHTGRDAKSTNNFSSRQVRRYLPTQAGPLGPQPSPEMKLTEENSILWDFR